MKTPQPKRPIVWIGIVGAGVVSAIVLAQSRQGAPNTAKAAETAHTAAPPRITVSAPTDRKPLSFYTQGVRGDLFSAEMPRAARPSVPKPTAPPPPPAMPAPVNPFADFAYTGTVIAGGQHMALVENTKTHEGQYLKQGDTFLGGKVSQIADRTLTIQVAGRDQVIAKTDTFKLTPLDKSAPYLEGGGQPGGPPGPGGPGGPGGPPPGAGGPMPGPAPAGALPGLPARLQKRLENMTPEQRTRVQNRFLNRQFEGGQRPG